MESRIPGAFALGKFGNFYVRTDGLISENDSTPDVTNGTLFFTNNTTETIITHFDLIGVTGGSVYQQFEGKQITLIMLDSATSISSGPQLLLSTSSSLRGSNNIISLIYHNSAWMELHRSINRNQVIRIESKNLGVSGVVDVKGITRIEVYSALNSAAVLRVLTNGEVGQDVYILAAGSHVQLIVNSASVYTLVQGGNTSNTSQMIAASDMREFTCFGNRWYQNG